MSIGGATIHPTRIVCLIALLAAGLAVHLPSAGAAVLSGTVTGGALPGRDAGLTLVRVVDLRTMEIVGADAAPRTGRWSVKGLPAGTYSALTVVFRTDGRLREAISVPVRARRTGRFGVRTSLLRRRAPAPRPRRGAVRPRVRGAAETGAREHATPTPVLVIDQFAGSGSEPTYGRALSHMLITEFTEADPDCPIDQREGVRDELVTREIAFQNSGFIDPSSRITPRPLAPTLRLRGSVVGTGDSITWSLQLVDVATGQVVGGDQGTARGSDGVLREAPEQIRDRLRNQICGARYDVALNVRTDATFASHIASGTISALLTATGTPPRRGIPPTRFTATGPLAYENLSFISTNECALSAPVSNPGAWSVVLEVTAAGRLRVTWQPEAAGGPPTGTATITCPTMPPVPVPGFPGPSLVNPDPTTFEMAIDGGQQSIAGGIQSGAQGWAHSGTLTIQRVRG